MFKQLQVCTVCHRRCTIDDSRSGRGCSINSLSLNGKRPIFGLVISGAKATERGLVFVGALTQLFFS